MSSLQEAEYATYTTREFLEVLLHTYVTTSAIAAANTSKALKLSCTRKFFQCAQEKKALPKTAEATVPSSLYDSNRSCQMS